MSPVPGAADHHGIFAGFEALEQRPVVQKRVHDARERIRVAGESRKLATTAIHVRATGVASGPPLPFVVEKTFHALRVGGQWKWILSADQYAYYSSGTCPYA